MITNQFIKKLKQTVVQDHLVYKKASPFKHLQLDKVLPEDEVAALLKAFPTRLDTVSWINYKHVNENKLGLNSWKEIPTTLVQFIQILQSEEFVSYLKNLTGIDNLVSDPTLEGGGLHMAKRGGFLNIHADFLSHPHKAKWKRKLNLLFFLNKDWKPEYKGELEFWSKDLKTCDTKILPLLNRMVIFRTDESSFHGFPEPLNCPEQLSRNSIALYYYSVEEENLSIQSTDYRHTDYNRNKAFLIWLDAKAVYVYTFLKRKLNINDKLVSNLLNLLSRKKSR